MLGGSGAQGVGYCAPARSARRSRTSRKGILTVTFQPDGDLMYSPGVLWTAAYHKIPILFVMHNNRAYHQETMHVQRMARLHNRAADTAWWRRSSTSRAIDFAKLAQRRASGGGSDHGSGEAGSGA
jgi:thiamine pyrophosphate-dependent acetolactate synthase large subunit-like protein